VPRPPGGGIAGKSLKYANDRVRGDLMGWFNGNEPGHEFEFLRWFGKKVPLVFAGAALATTTRYHGDRVVAVWPAQVGTLVSELGAQVPELKNIAGRSKYMVCTAPACCSRDLAHVGALRRRQYIRAAVRATPCTC
jgi:hypothetical protein